VFSLTWKVSQIRFLQFQHTCVYSPAGVACRTKTKTTWPGCVEKSKAHALSPSPEWLLLHESQDGASSSVRLLPPRSWPKFLWDGWCGDSVRNRTHDLTSATMLTNHNAKRANAQLGWFFVGSADSSRQQVLIYIFNRIPRVPNITAQNSR